MILVEGNSGRTPKSRVKAKTKSKEKGKEKDKGKEKAKRKKKDEVAEDEDSETPMREGPRGVGENAAEVEVGPSKGPPLMRRPSEEGITANPTITQTATDDDDMDVDEPLIDVNDLS
jgi:hypothetical protein